ncbi:hypothetical protein P7C70_g5439, partial [Phenoliferia sp. Uapishka_3]
MTFDISDFDPCTPSSIKLFPSTPQTTGPNISATRPTPPPPLPTIPTTTDPLSAFSNLDISSPPSNPTLPEIPSPQKDAQIRAHQARQEAVMLDLQRDPFGPPVTLTSEPESLPSRTTGSPHLIHPMRPNRHGHSSEASSSFSPPRRLSGLMSASPSSSPQLHRSTSTSVPAISSPTLDIFHPASPPLHSAESAFRRTASSSGSLPHPHLAHHAHTIDPSNPPGHHENIFSDLLEGIPQVTDPLKMAWAMRGKAVTMPFKREREPRREPSGDHWKKEWTYDASGEDAVQGIQLLGVRDGVHRALDEDVAEGIRPNLPPRLRISSKWTLLYSLDQHGISMATMYERMRVGLLGADGGIVIVVEDDSGAIFGAYVNEGLKEGHGYYGDGSWSDIFRFQRIPSTNLSFLSDSFLWTSTPFAKTDFRVGSSVRSFRWTGRNSYFVLSEASYLSVGGGDGKFGLWVDGVFEKGFTTGCETFGNEPLTREERWEKVGDAVESKFEVVRFECWAVGL